MLVHNTAEKGYTMAKKDKKLNMNPGWYVSNSDFERLPRQLVPFYTFTGEKWYKYDTPIELHRVPEDLWPIRHVQR